MYFSDTKPLWMKFEDYPKLSNNIESAVYAFAMCDKVPDEKTFPCFIENTIYVGQSGGLSNNYTMDRKNKDVEKYRYQTVFHQRMKKHSTEFNKTPESESQERKYKLFYEQYGYGEQIYRGDLTGKFLCLCILIPPKHLTEDIIKTWLLMVESEIIYLYHKHYDNQPLMNLAHKSSASVGMLNKNSLSQKEINRVKKQNIFELSL